MNDQINLTVGGPLRALQGAPPIIMHARREPVPDDWDLFHVEPDGEAVAVIF